MKNQKLSKLDIAIKACQDTLECIKKQQEFNKFLFTEHKCPTCGTIYTNKEDADFIDEVGECYRCDHVRGEVTDDLHDEAKAFEDDMNEELYGSGEGPDHTVENWDGETSEDKWFADAGVDSSFEEDR